VAQDVKGRTASRTSKKKEKMQAVLLPMEELQTRSIYDFNLEAKATAISTASLTIQLPMLGSEIVR